MDQATKDMIRALAEERGLDPEALLAAVAPDVLPEDVDAALAETLKSVGLFARARKEANDDRAD